MSDKLRSKKRYQIELTPLSIVLWGISFLILLSWSFFLGILLGQGFLPGAVTAISDLKGQINKIQEMVKTTDTLDSRPNKTREADPKLAFYERLASKKDEVKKEHLPVEKPERQDMPKIENTPITPRISSLAEKETPAANQSKKIQSKTTSPEMPFTVQVASLESEDNAAGLMNKLIKQGYPAYYYSTEVEGKTLYRVRCGRFVTREDADQYVRKLAKEAGIKGFVSRIE